MERKTNFKIISIIIFTSILLAFIYNLFSADGIPFIREPLMVEKVNIDNDNIGTDGLKGLDLANTINLYNQKNALFIDARDQWEYGEGHIKGVPEMNVKPVKGWHLNFKS